MANNEDNGIDEIDQIRSNNENNSNMAKEYAKGKTKQLAAKHGKKAALRVGRMALSVVSLKAIVIALAVILVIIMLIGFVSFIFLGPDMVRGKIVEFLDDIFTPIKGFFIGNAEAQVKDEDVLNIANYLDNMGYKLEGYGFVENKDQVTRDDQGKITKIDSKYIAAYLAAENKTYMIANNNFDLRSMFKNFTNTEQGTWGSGLIVINRNLWASMTGPNVEVNRKEQTLDIHIKGKGNSEETIYQYDLDGWMGRYGKPLEFLLALHIGTMAPDFAYEVATSAEMDTKVYVKLRKISTITRLKYNGMYVISHKRESDGAWISGWDEFIKNEAVPEINKANEERKRMVDEYNQEIQAYNAQPGAVQQPLLRYEDYILDVEATLKEWYGFNQADIEDARKYEEEHTKITYKPYIRAVNNHWFRDLDFKDAYVQAKTGTFEGGNYGVFTIEEEVSGDIYQIKEPKVVGSDSTVKFEDITGETLTLGKESSKTNTNSTNNTNNTTSTAKLTSGNEIFNVDGVDDATKLANLKLGATNEAATTNNANNSGANNSSTNNSEANNTTDNIYEGYRLDNLFKKKYKIADGLNGMSDEEQPLRIRNTMRYALTMLENVHTLDAQYILRDLKLYLKKRGFTFPDQYIITDPKEAEKRIKEQEDNRNLEYGGTRYTQGDIHMNGRILGGGNQSAISKPLGSILDGNSGAVEIQGNTVILYHKSANHTEGFDTGAKVKSPGSGEVVAVSANAITIKLTEKDVVDYKITISGFNVDSSIVQQGKISKGQQIGLTSDSDITVTMVNKEGKAVNPADYLPIISGSASDVDELARLIQAEDGMSSDGMAAVAWVILNRVSSSSFPNTVHDVIYASGQFAPTWDGSMNRQASSTALNVARGVLSGTIGDPLTGLLDGGKAYYFLGREGTGFVNYDYSMLRNNRICRLFGGNGAGHGNVFFCQWSDQNRI